MRPSVCLELTAGCALSAGGVDHKRIAVSPWLLRPQAGKAPEVKAIHAGLECGIIGEKLPGLDCVSYGPTIT